jgi:hypothetical protein
MKGLTTRSAKEEKFSVMMFLTMQNNAVWKYFVAVQTHM